MISILYVYVFYYSSYMLLQSKKRYKYIYIIMFLLHHPSKQSPTLIFLLYTGHFLHVYTQEHIVKPEHIP